MLSNEIVYEKATIFSPRLGKDIEVETYAGDNGSIVISAISLRDAAKIYWNNIGSDVPK